MKRTTTTATVLMGLVGLVYGSPAQAQQADAQQPRQAADDTWISVSGTVVKTGPDGFRLDYGKGVITVEMDDFDAYREGHQLLENDQVVVYGKIDDDLFEKRSIEASSVYVENLRTHFYASAVDDEDLVAWSVIAPVKVGRVEVAGRVKTITDRKFTIDTGKRQVTVDTASLAFNPLDDTGFLRVDVGDRVRVAGALEDPLFADRVLAADWIIELEK